MRQTARPLIVGVVGGSGPGKTTVIRAIEASVPDGAAVIDQEAPGRSSGSASSRRAIVLADGILLFADARIRRLFDIRIFVDVADDVRFIRRLLRDVTERGRSVERVIEQYLATVRPMHLEFVEPSKRHADIIIPEGGENRVGIDMILAHVQRELRLRTAGAET